MYFKKKISGHLITVPIGYSHYNVYFYNFFMASRDVTTVLNLRITLYIFSLNKNTETINYQ